MALYLPDGVRLYEPSLDQLVHATFKANSWLSGGVVSAQGVPAMSVKISAGVIQADGGVVTAPAVDPLAIGIADPALPRIDSVIVTRSTGVVSVVPGTPNATPKPAALPTTAILAAYVSVAAAALNIQPSNITDMRLQGALPMIAGTLAQRPTASVQTGMTYYATNDGLFRSTGAAWVKVGPLVAGTASDYVAIGVNPATSGHLRLPNTGTIGVRNNTNTGDITLLRFDASHDAWFAQDQLTITNGGLATFIGSVGVAIGTNPATAGTIRIPNAGIVYARNAANTGNIGLIYDDASDNVHVGDSGFRLNLDASAGNVNIGYAVTALGGGAAPTVGTIGGSGPAAAAQNSWLKILINGTASFLPVWR